MMWTYNRMCTSKARLDGKVAIITGANTGIGQETARDFYRRGARVILACRNIEKAKAAMEDIKNNPSPNKQYKGKLGELEIYSLDLSNLKTVKECAKKLLTDESAIHILVNNAGVMMCPHEKTKDGFELQLQSNHLGHFLLTLLLLPKIQSSAPGCKIINVSSICHLFGKIHFNDLNLDRSYSPMKAYAQSKLANILFTKELARRLKEAGINGINIYSLHPGVIRTELSRHYSRTIIPGARFFYRKIMRPFIKNPVQGAQTTIHCAVDEKVANETGLYYVECRVSRPQWRARDDQIAKDLWNHTCQLLHLEPDENLSTFLQTVSRQLAE
ncbi:retinol dehydrogenase 11-like [Nylanderia fulva]|uniref:retinol dehydrogenase 11-like n=1 Tax=Nylanderia fulva TaxID=613905 RepID=UPI0010FB68A0|nr:retinol dehydrogenase 11-like [Nylanderia fulva]